MSVEEGFSPCRSLGEAGEAVQAGEQVEAEEVVEEPEEDFWLLVVQPGPMMCADAFFQLQSECTSQIRSTARRALGQPSLWW